MWLARNDEIWLAELPAFDPFWQRRQVRIRPFDAALSHPPLDEFEFFGLKGALFQESAVSRFGQPGRHDSSLGNFGNLLGALPDVLKVQQTERRGLARSMASGTMLENNRRNVPGEGHGILAIKPDLGRPTWHCGLREIPDAEEKGHTDGAEP